MTRPTVLAGGALLLLLVIANPLASALSGVLTALVMAGVMAGVIAATRPRGGTRLRIDYEREADPGLSLDVPPVLRALLGRRDDAAAPRHCQCHVAHDTPRVIRATAPPRAITRATPPAIDAPRRRAITPREDDTTW